jgi:hypothetical protein
MVNSSEQPETSELYLNLVKIHVEQHIFKSDTSYLFDPMETFKMDFEVGETYVKVLRNDKDILNIVDKSDEKWINLIELFPLDLNESGELKAVVITSSCRRWEHSLDRISLAQVAFSEFQLVYNCEREKFEINHD